MFLQLFQAHAIHIYLIFNEIFSLTKSYAQRTLQKHYVILIRISVRGQYLGFACFCANLEINQLINMQWLHHWSIFQIINDAN